MKKKVMAITYEPKIEPVKDGRCTQTIRRGDKVSKGDEILFHGWIGLPYRSKWNNRQRVTVKEVIHILISGDGIKIRGGWFYSWYSEKVRELAELDYIFPATGFELKKVLFGLNSVPTEPEKYQIIRW